MSRQEEPHSLPWVLCCCFYAPFVVLVLDTLSWKDCTSESEYLEFSASKKNFYRLQEEPEILRSHDAVFLWSFSENEFFGESFLAEKTTTLHKNNEPRRHCKLRQCLQNGSPALQALEGKSRRLGCYTRDDDDVGLLVIPEKILLWIQCPHSVFIASRTEGHETFILLFHESILGEASELSFCVSSSELKARMRQKGNKRG